MENDQTPENLFKKSNDKNKQLINVSITLGIQIILLFVSGKAMSMYDPLSPWATSETFRVSAFVGFIDILVFPLFGIFNTIFIVSLLKKKNYSILIWIALITSLCFATISPANYVSKKIAGLTNYNWTEQAALDVEKLREKRKEDLKIYAKEEAAADIWVKEHDKLLGELYQKFKINVEGEHKIIGIDKANLKITIDNGQTYILNTDSIIKKTADSSVISTYNDIMDGKYKNHIYLFTVGDYQTFKNYYDWSSRDNDVLKKSIDNFETWLFVISIPTLLK